MSFSASYWNISKKMPEAEKQLKNLYDGFSENHSGRHVT